jgi:SPP1 family predicted phage head-tail adaptor
MAAAGKLRDRIGLLAQIPATDPRWGPGNEWQQYATAVPAGVIPLMGTQAGSEAPSNEGVQSEVSYTITLRYRTDVKNTDRILYRGQTLEVVSAVDPDGLRRTLEIQARAYAGVQ